MSDYELKKQYGIKSHYSPSYYYDIVRKKGLLTKELKDCKKEEIYSAYARYKSIKNDKVQCDCFNESGKVRKPCHKIGKYKASVPGLSFQPPKELKDQFIANCAEFGINYGEILTRLLTDSKWETWNNREWLENFKKGTNND